MINDNNSIAIINCKAPFASPNAKDALDIALIMGSYEQQTHLYFIGDGVWQLVANQQPGEVNVKDFLKTFAAFEFYDLEHVYVCQQSLAQRGLTNEFHIENVQLLSPQQIADQLAHHATVLTF